MAEEKKLILPEELRQEVEKSTERKEKRSEEDMRYLPVIIKRDDQTLRHPDDTLENVIREGLEQLRRPLLSLALSSMAAGLILSFTVIAVAVVTSAVTPYDQGLLRRLAVALVYPFGFVICVMSGTQLFTEHTATGVYPVLDRKAPLKLLLRLWAVVIVGNMIGALCSAVFLNLAESIIHAQDGYVTIGEHLVKHDTLPLLVSALLAGWLMALGGWLVMANPSSTGQILSIYMVTFLIGVGGLHHSIAGSVEIFTALMMAHDFTLYEAIRFILLALIGNLIGGSFFVAVLNYGHVRQTQSQTTPSPAKQNESSEEQQ